MKPQRVKHQLADGRVKVYTYAQVQRNISATELARRMLEQHPLIRIVSKKLTRTQSAGFRWSRTGKRVGHIFNHSTIQPLLDSGWAICHGDIIEKKGVVR